jgi:uncharacterized metal-binding protein
MAGQIPKRTVVYGCAGASNTGQLANAAAVRMTQRGTGRIGCLGGVGSGQKGFVTAARLADEVVAIDGCEVGCARKTLEAAGVTPNRHVVVSDLGIEKSGDLALRYEEIDRVVTAAETAPSTGTDPKQPPTDDGGCGCGCSDGGGSGCCG